jgi:hypothetical protein
MIPITIYNILGIAVGSIFITSFYTPIQGIKNRLLDKLPDSTIGRSCQTILSCPKCLGFIFSLFMFWDILAAVLTSLLAYFINHLIDRVEAWYE